MPGERGDVRKKKQHGEQGGNRSGCVTGKQVEDQPRQHQPFGHREETDPEDPQQRRSSKGCGESPDRLGIRQRCVEVYVCCEAL